MLFSAPPCCITANMSVHCSQMQSSTAEAKAQYDAAELSLQNLLYEKGHYLKEIRACRSFRSACFGAASTQQLIPIVKLPHRSSPSQSVP